MMIKALLLPSKQYITCSKRIGIEEDTKDFMYLCEIWHLCTIILITFDTKMVIRWFQLGWKLDLNIFPTIYYMRQRELSIKSYSCSKLSWEIWRLQGNKSVSYLTSPCHSDFFKAAAYFRILHFMVTSQHVCVIIDTSVLFCFMTRFCEVGYIILGSYNFFLFNDGRESIVNTFLGFLERS